MLQGGGWALPGTPNPGHREAGAPGAPGRVVLSSRRFPRRPEAWVNKQESWRKGRALDECNPEEDPGENLVHGA